MAQDDYKLYSVSIKDLIIITILAGLYLSMNNNNNFLLLWWCLGTIIMACLGNCWIGAADMIVATHCIFIISSNPLLESYDHLLYFFYQWCSHSLLLYIHKDLTKIPGIYTIFWAFIPNSLFLLLA